MLLPRSHLVHNEKNDGRRRAARELEDPAQPAWSITRKLDITNNPNRVSQYEIDMLHFAADDRLHKTSILASPILRRLLAKLLLACTTVSDEEDAIEHIRVVAGLLSRMSAPPFNSKEETVDTWINKYVPTYVQRTEPAGSNQVSNNQRCETLKNALQHAQTLGDVAAYLEVTVTCGMYAGMIHATWMMESGMHTTQLRDIYPDSMEEALEYLKYFSDYSTMFGQMERDQVATPDLLSAVQGDSNFIHAVQAFLYGRGICGADGSTTCSPWHKIISWMIDVEGDLKNEWDSPASFKAWTRKTTLAVENAAEKEYMRTGGDKTKGKAAVQWIVKTFNAKSTELQSVVFMTGQGVPKDQNIKMLNFKYARTLFDALAQGPEF
jgi:hypothetical protein